MIVLYVSLQKKCVVEEFLHGTLYVLYSREIYFFIPSHEFLHIKEETLQGRFIIVNVKVRETFSDVFFRFHHFKNSINYFLLLYLCAMRKLIIIIAVCMLLFSCASKGPKRIDSAGNLYVDGVNLLQAKKYSKAIEKFSTLRENHPFDPLAIVAAVKLGDTYFAKKEYILAAGVYEDFFKSHPDDENVPYVLSRLGECYDKESLTIDRDQEFTLKAIERLTYLKNRYPTNTYTKESEPRLAKMIQKLADRELYVGEFYYRSAQYNASIVRLEYFLAKYPNAKGIDKALLYLAQSYRELGNQEKSDFYLNRLQTEYPKSLYARTTIRERKTLQPTKSDTVKGTTDRFLFTKRRSRETLNLWPQTVKADQVVVTESAKEQTPVKNTEKTTEKETIKDTGKKARKKTKRVFRIKRMIRIKD